MFAAYCSTLKDDKKLTESEKSERLKDYISEVRRAITAKETTKAGGKKTLAKKTIAGKQQSLPSAPSTGKNTAITSHGQTGGITGQNVTVNIMGPKASDSKPVLFRIDDPNLIEFHRYIIPKDIGTKFRVRDEECPPCLTVELAELHPDWTANTGGKKTAPHVVFKIGGYWCGINGFNALGQGVTLKEGCGARLSSGYYDVIFEIINDRITTLEVWVAVFSGTLTNKCQTQLLGMCP